MIDSNRKILKAIILAFVITVSGLLTGCGETAQNAVPPKQDESVIDTTAVEEAETPVEQSIEEPTEEEQQTTYHLQTFDAPVVEVIDGDTIKVKIGDTVESVRFLLVDTPEITRGKNEPFGKEAKDLIMSLVEGKTVQLEKDVSERDKYGRLLMYLYIDGISLQEELLKQGLARVAYVYAPNTKYVDRYYELQKEAQAKAIGIWSIENYATDKGFQPEVMEKPAQPEPNTDCNIKGNINSKGEKIYHVPGGAFYEKTDINTAQGERYFCSREEAEAAGWRASQR